MSRTVKAGAREWLLSHKNSTDSNFFNNGKGAQVTAIVSGKGGVGKTSVAVKLATLLANSGKKTLLIDCDHNLSNTCIKLGIPLSDDFWSLVNMGKEFEECVQKQGNLHVLGACNGNEDLFDSGLEFDKVIIDIVREQEHRYDHIILDCAAGIGRHTLNLAAMSDQRIVVVTPDKSSITDSYSLVKLLELRHGIKTNHLLINRAVGRNQYVRVLKTLQKTVETYLSGTLRELGAIPEHTRTTEDFDKVLLKSAGSSIHRSFSKLLLRFTDEHLGGVAKEFAFCATPAHVGDLEHDVQSSLSQGVP